MVFEAALAGELLAAAFELTEQKLTRAFGGRVEKLELIVTFRFLENLEVFTR